MYKHAKTRQQLSGALQVTPLYPWETGKKIKRIKKRYYRTKPRMESTEVGKVILRKVVH